MHSLLTRNDLSLNFGVNFYNYNYNFTKSQTLQRVHLVGVEATKRFFYPLLTRVNKNSVILSSLFLNVLYFCINWTIK